MTEQPRPLHIHTPAAKGTLGSKLGQPLYKATYNTNTMTSGVFDGTFTAPDSNTAAFG